MDSLPPVVQTPPVVKKPRRSQAMLRIMHYDLGILSRQLRTILGREVKWMLEASYKKRLPPKDADSLMKYTRLVKELQRQEEQELAGLSDEELATRAGEIKVDTKETLDDARGTIQG